MSSKKRKKHAKALQDQLQAQPLDPRLERQQMAAQWLAGDKQVFQRALDSKARRVAEEGETPFTEMPPTIGSQIYKCFRICVLLYVSHTVFIGTAEDFLARSWGFFGTLWLFARLLFLLITLAYFASIALLYCHKPMYDRWTATSRSRWAKMYASYYSRNHISQADAERKAREYFPDCKVRQKLWRESVADLRRRCFDAGASFSEVGEAIGSIFREGGSRAAKDDLIELYLQTKEKTKVAVAEQKDTTNARVASSSNDAS